MTDDEAHKRGLPRSDSYIRSQLAYRDEINNTAFVVYLNGEALKAFKSAVGLIHDITINSEGAQLANWFGQGQVGEMPQMPYSFSRMHYINLESLLIGSAFELHFKAELLSKGCVIHRLNDDLGAYQALHEQQSERPIAKDELFSIEGYAYDKDRQINVLRGLSDKSIDFNYFFKSKYKKELDVPSNINELANYYRKLRNQIHMPGDPLDIKLPEAYKNRSYAADLKQYINTNVVAKTNALVAKQGIHGFLTDI